MALRLTVDRPRKLVQEQFQNDVLINLKIKTSYSSGSISQLY